MMELMELVEWQIQDKRDEIQSRFRNGCIMGMMKMESVVQVCFGFLNFLNSKTMLKWEMRGVGKILRSLLGMMGMKCLWNLKWRCRSRNGEDLRQTQWTEEGLARDTHWLAERLRGQRGACKSTLMLATFDAGADRGKHPLKILQDRKAREWQG